MRPSSPPRRRNCASPETSDDIAAIRRGDILLHHPYDSFKPVLDFINAAAADPDVLAIKQTLYRVGRNAPVVRSLLEAQRNGKQVAVLVELKPRFDKESNIGWAPRWKARGCMWSTAWWGSRRTARSPWWCAARRVGCGAICTCT